MAHAEVPQIALELSALLGADRVRRPQLDESGSAEIIVEAASAAEVAEVVRKCEADQISLAAVGACRSLSQIRAWPVAVGVSLARMAAVVAYEPDDMTIVAQAGIELGALNRHAAARRQHLALDPPRPDVTALGALIAAAPHSVRGG